MDSKQLNNEKLNDVNGGLAEKEMAKLYNMKVRPCSAAAAGAAVSNAAKCGAAKSGLIDEVDVAEVAAKYRQSVPDLEILGALKR